MLAAISCSSLSRSLGSSYGGRGAFIPEEELEQDAELLLSLRSNDGVFGGLPPRPPTAAPQMRRRSSAASLDDDGPSDEREDSPSGVVDDDDDGLGMEMEMEGTERLAAKMGAFSMPLGVVA